MSVAAISQSAVSCPKKEQIMGKGMLTAGLTILLFGLGPWMIFAPEHSEHPGNLTEFLFLGLAMVSFLPGIILTAVGGVTCIYNFISDRLPY